MAQRIMKEQEFESDVFDRGTWQKVFDGIGSVLDGRGVGILGWYVVNLEWVLDRILVEDRWSS